VTGLGLGCAPLGNLFRAVSDEAASATVEAAWTAGIRYFDTAPLYGHGRSERRLGRALRGLPRGEVVVSTQVGRLLRPPTGEPTETIFADAGDLEPQTDFSADGVRRSLEESLERLGLDRVDVVFVHDPDDHERAALDGAFPALCELRDRGVVRAVGAGMNQTAMLERFVERVDLDCVLLAGRYTLLDRSGAERLLPLCEQRGVGVVLGGVFNSGVLADPSPGATYDYAAADPSVLRRAQRMAHRCDAHGVALPAAALRFAMSHPAVSTVVVGARHPEEITADVAWASAAIPPVVRSELRRL
jgi:D-threo-aldose 1-dehydrogenase